MLGVLGWVGSLRLQKKGLDHICIVKQELISSMTEMSKHLSNGRTMEACLTPFHPPLKVSY